jgi:hypothetical protein
MGQRTKKRTKVVGGDNAFLAKTLLNLATDGGGLGVGGDNTSVVKILTPLGAVGWARGIKRRITAEPFGCFRHKPATLHQRERLRRGP